MTILREQCTLLSPRNLGVVVEGFLHLTSLSHYALDTDSVGLIQVGTTLHMGRSSIVIFQSAVRAIQVFICEPDL